jgi:hypothetical protein
MDAYVLVQTQIGRAREVTLAIGRLPGVVYAEPITGPCDVVVRIFGRDLRTLNGTLIAGIQEIASVTLSLTCPIVAHPALVAVPA